jgi:hypothetical protein
VFCQSSDIEDLPEGFVSEKFIREDEDTFVNISRSAFSLFLGFAAVFVYELPPRTAQYSAASLYSTSENLFENADPHREQKWKEAELTLLGIGPSVGN